MVEIVQKVIQDFCLSALALLGAGLAIHGIVIITRRFFVRVKAIGLAICFSIAVAVAAMFGGSKTNELLQVIFPFVPQVQQMPTIPVSIPTNHVPIIAATSPRASATMPFRAAKWNVRGAWDDSFRYAFSGDWEFPFSTGHLDRVEVCSQGRIIPYYGSSNVIVSVGVPLGIVNPITSFGCGPTDHNSYIFSWTNAVVGRVLHEDVANAETMDASIEFFRSGDIAVTTNGITTLIPRVLPFPHDGFGQDAEWVSGNFTNATEILAVGYPQWVDAQVGENLTNGLYKFTVTVPDVPPETIQLVVGNYSVAVTNSGDYVFLLEKGIDYQYGTIPFQPNVMYSAVDDVPQTRGTLRSEETDGPIHAWTVDGGYGINAQTNATLGLVWWMPFFFGSPDVPHLGPDDNPLTFTANFSDCRVAPAASYSWAASEGITISSPNAKSTQISADSMPSWAEASVSVTATVGDHVLESHLYGFSVGTNDTPQVRLSLNIPNAILLNSNAVDAAKVAVAGWSFSSDVPTSGVVTVSCISGGDKIECQGLLGTWEVSNTDDFSVEAHIQGVSTSAAVGDVTLQATFTTGDMVVSELGVLTVVQTKDVVLPAAPVDGLVVLKNTPVSMQLACEPTGAGTYLTTTWHVRRLNLDGSHESWWPVASDQAGVFAWFAPTQGGIYQIRALASVAAGGTDERFYVWDADENTNTGLKKRGDLKAFGVCDEQWQIGLRGCAKTFIGSTDYLEMVEVSEQYGFSASPGSSDNYKCNLFVAHRAVQIGLSVPAIHGRLWRNHPPLANEWGDRSFVIQGWSCVGTAEFPQPGYVVSEPHENCPGHVGVVDFDGMGISAGKDNVNRRFNACSPQTIMRKFTGGNNNE